MDVFLGYSVHVGRITERSDVELQMRRSVSVFSLIYNFSGHVRNLMHFAMQFFSNFRFNIFC